MQDFSMNFFEKYRSEGEDTVSHKIIGINFLGFSYVAEWLF